MISPHWHGVCRSGDLLPDATVHADVNRVAICLVRNNGQVYALHDECTHAEVQLSEGEVSNGTIGCWLHGSRFDLATGRCAQPARHRAGRGLSGQAHQGWRGPHLPGSCLLYTSDAADE